MKKILWGICIVVLATGFLSNNGHAQRMMEAPDKRAEETYQTTSYKKNSYLPNEGMNAPDFYVGIHTPKDDIKDDEQDAHPSLIEKTFSKRAEKDITQFGYSLFSGKTDTRERPVGMVQDTYLLGPGDTVQVTFRGQRDDSDTYVISPEGMLTVDQFAPVHAAGLSLGDLKMTLERMTQESLINSTVYVSLKGVRQVSVLVMGEVNKPGRHNLSAFHTVVDALYKAHGIKKTGSLRQIKLVRDGEKFMLDLYQLVLDGELSTNMQLRDGDRIIVPMLGSTVAVSGDVKRPAIFETPPNREGYRLDDLIMLSGGILKTGANRYISLSLDPEGMENVTPVSPEKPVTFYDGYILLVQAAQEKRSGSITLKGAVSRPGTHALVQKPTLSAVFNNGDALENNAYPLLALIHRFNKKTLSDEYIPFSPKQVIEGLFDRQLNNDDTLIVFSSEDIRNMKDIIARSEKQTQEEFSERSAENDALLADDKENKKKEPDTQEDIAQSLLRDKKIQQILQASSVRVRGAVQFEGPYPVAGTASVGELIAVAGGVASHANLSEVQITFAHGAKQGERLMLNLNRAGEESLALSPDDTLLISEKFTPVETVGVTIKGEVRYPGTYDLKKGDTIMDLIRRAGGLTDYAYPEGAIFTRASARRKEEEQYKQAARELNRRLAMAMTTNDDDQKEKSGAQTAMMRDLITELQKVKALGRITVEARPDALVENPDKAILLEKGDLVYFPKRPYTVSVRGEVLAPAELAYDDDFDAHDYVRAAGGTTRLADDEKAFVVFPNGSSQPVPINSWGGSSLDIPPGSTLIVPRDPEPFDTMAFTTNVLGILSNLAITGMAIDDITDN